MKKFIFTLALLALPTSTWQVFANGILTVYTENTPNSNIYYQGVPSGYDGGATAKPSTPNIIGITSHGTSTPSL